MGTHPLLDPNSTVRLVYETLSTVDAGALTQAQLCLSVGRTKGAVCKALQWLVEKRYAKRAGKTPPRAAAKSQFLFTGTGKVFGKGEDLPELAACAALTAAMNGMIREGLMRAESIRCPECGREWEKTSVEVVREAGKGKWRCGDCNSARPEQARGRGRSTEKMPRKAPKSPSVPSENVAPPSPLTSTPEAARSPK